MSSIQWSYSALKQFQNCARQYHEMKVLKNFVSEDNDATIYGKDVHTALELYVRHDTPLPKLYEKFAKPVDALKAIRGEKHCELKMGLKADRVTACEFDDPEYWVHGICDLAIVDDDLGFAIDYKTGNPRYADTKQLRLMALMLFARFPSLQLIRSGLLFLAHDIFVPEEYTRADIKTLWIPFDHSLKQLELYTEMDKWPGNPTGLCKRHCPVVTCTYNGRH